MFQLMNSSEGYLARLYRFFRPHVIVYSLPTWEARDVLHLLKANSFGELEIISIVGWLGIILVKGFSFFVPIITANSLPWAWQGCLRSNLSAGKLACVTGLGLGLKHKQHREFWSIFWVWISIGLFSLLSQWLLPGLHILRHLGIY